MIFSAKPVPCMLVVNVELRANIGGIIWDVFPMQSASIAIPACRATELVTSTAMLGAIEALRRKVEALDRGSDT